MNLFPLKNYRPTRLRLDTKSGHQKTSKKFKANNDLNIALPGAVIDNLDSFFLPYVKTFDVIFSSIFEKRDGSNKTVVKNFYNTLNAFSRYGVPESGLHYAETRFNAIDFLKKEYSKIRSSGKAYSFVLELEDSHMPEWAKSKTQRIAWIKNKFAEYNRIFAKVWGKLAYTLEIEREKDGTYQIHAHGLCSKEDYILLNSKQSSFDYTVSKREVKFSPDVFVGYMTKDQVVTKQEYISKNNKVINPSREKNSDVNSEFFTINTYMEKYAHIPKSYGVFSEILHKAIAKNNVDTSKVDSAEKIKKLRKMVKKAISRRKSYENSFVFARKTDDQSSELFYYYGLLH